MQWGILGTGRICQDFAQALSVGTSKIVAVGSRKLDTVLEFADRFRIPNRHASYEALVRDESVNIIYVGTPNASHHEHIMLALSNGKHVLCEKPLVLNESQAAECIEFAAEKKLFLMEAMWSRFQPWAIKVRQLLSESAIGQVQIVEASLGHAIPGKPPSLFESSLGGGALLNMGVYPVSLASMIYRGQEPSQIAALAEVDQGVDTHIGVLLKYGPGQLALLSSSMICTPSNGAVIRGTKGTITVDGPMFHASEQITLTRTGERAEVIPCPFEYKHAADVKWNFYNSQGLLYEALEVEKCILAGKLESEIMPLSESLLITRIMDKVRDQVDVVYPGEKAGKKRQRTT